MHPRALPVIRPGQSTAGFTLLEALVALAIVSMVVLGYLSVRTNALIDAGEARNWRLAREIAEEKLSELNAGARELPPESGNAVPLDDKFPGFSFRIYIGESDIGQMEAEIANTGDEEDQYGYERSQWQQSRDTMRRANSRGLSYFEYQDQLAKDEEARQRQEKPPSETDFEEVAVVVFFPTMNPEQKHDDAFVLKAKVSTLALAGMTPEQAQVFAESKGQTITNANQSGGAAGAEGNSANGSGGKQ